MAATKGDDDWILLCTMCSLGMKVQILQEPKKDYNQVTEDFNKIPLTDKKALFAKKRNERKSKTNTTLL